MIKSRNVPHYKELLVTWRACNRVGNFTISVGVIVMFPCFIGGHWAEFLLSFLVILAGGLYFTVGRIAVSVRDMCITGWQTEQLLEMACNETSQ